MSKVLFDIDANGIFCFTIWNNYGGMTRGYGEQYLNAWSNMVINDLESNLDL